MMRIKYLSLALCFTLVSCQTTPKVGTPIMTSEEREDKDSAVASGKNYAISTHGKYASLAAAEMFKEGGNIIDAAVAASFVISVERPQSTGIGGGGFMLFHEAKTGDTYAIDFRERAPLKAHENMYLDKDKKPIPQKSREGALAAAVPGMVAGLIEIHKRFGKLPLPKVMSPAISLAENGFDIYPDLHKALTVKKDLLAKDSATKKIFLTEDGQVPEINSLLVQKDLAKTLTLISKKGAAGFYKGSTAKAITAYSKAAGGIMEQKDLDHYKVIWRKPVEARVSDFEVVSMPPPSSGGIHVVQFLKMLQDDKLKESGPLSTKSLHLAASTLQSAFADRAKFLGDPDFVRVPTNALIDSEYLKERREEIPANRARLSTDVFAGAPPPKESDDTTHFSLIDAAGNAVASTQTINGWMGAGVVVPGTGILLNNEMDDFSAQSGDSNLFGAIGGNANAIAPMKTPLSSMSPTILLRNNKPFMAVGAPGGTRIISCVAQTILNYTEFKLPLYESVTMLRYHHQWKPDTLFIDPPGPSAEVLKQLKKMGYNVQIQPIGCKVMAVAKEGDNLIGVSDPRDIGISVAH